jgi:hypothetical protein
MARGIDTRLQAARQVGHGSPLHQRIQAEAATQSYLFGTLVGTQDDGERTLKRPAPVGGAEGSNPVYRGTPPSVIKYATMVESHQDAMAGLMQPAPSNDRKTEGLVDVGMGRLSDGVERPVTTRVDPSIKKK